MVRIKLRQNFRYACGNIIGQHGVDKTTFCWLVPWSLYHQFPLFTTARQGNQSSNNQYEPLSKVVLAPNRSGEIVLAKLNCVLTLNRFNAYRKNHHKNIKTLGLINGTVGLINGLPTTIANPMDQSITTIDYLQAVSSNQLNEGIDLVIKGHSLAPKNQDGVDQDAVFSSHVPEGISGPTSDQRESSSI